MFYFFPICYLSIAPFDTDYLSYIRNVIYNGNDIKAEDITYPEVNYPCPSKPYVFEGNIDRTVVINSFSNSMGSEIILWEEIINLLHKHGYIVYSNVLKNQTELKGTKRLECSLNEFYNICDQINLLISIRSGIVDFVANTRCKKIVMWFDSDKNRDVRKLCDLNAWRKDNILQIDVEDFDDVISRIRTYL